MTYWTSFGAGDPEVAPDLGEGGQHPVDGEGDEGEEERDEGDELAGPEPFARRRRSVARHRGRLRGSTRVSPRAMTERTSIATKARWYEP